MSNSGLNGMRFVILTVILSSPSLFSMDRTSQTFFMPRGIAESSMLELALQGYRLYHNNYNSEQKPYSSPKNRALLNIQSNYVYQESDNDGGLAKYFLPTGRSNVSFIQKGGTGVVASKWFGLARVDEEFNSNVQLAPERKVYGTILNYHNDLSKFVEGLWFSALLPIVHVQHKLNIRETNQGGQGEDAEVKTIIDALNQSSFSYGKFSSLGTTKVGIDDLQLKFGINAVKEGDARVGLYTDFFVPLNGRDLGENVFGYVLGNGGHGAIGFGTNFELDLAEYNKHNVSFVGDIRYRYFFSGTEHRSFDLKDNGPWSRYLLVVKPGSATDPVAGINFFTKDLKVFPRDTAEVFAALHYNYSDFNLEAGYAFWWRNSEKVKLKSPWNENIGIFNPFAVNPNEGTASRAKISQSFNDVQPDPDNKFVTISQSDLDLLSAAHKTAVSHTLYAGASFDTEFLDSPWMVGAGGSYELARDNAAMSNWSIWLKTCMSF